MQAALYYHTLVTPHLWQIITCFINLMNQVYSSLENRLRKALNFRLRILRLYILDNWELLDIEGVW